MKPALTQILVTFGILFIFLILIGIYFYIADPMNLKPMIFGTDSDTKQNSEVQGSAEGSFQLSESQKQALVSAGMDPANVPTSISAEQESCFVDRLGEARVAEIKGGAVPSGIEIVKAKSCI